MDGAASWAMGGAGGAAMKGIQGAASALKGTQKLAEAAADTVDAANDARKNVTRHRGSSKDKNGSLNKLEENAPRGGLVDEILDGTRTVSGASGFKNSARLSRSALTSLKLQAKELGVTFVKNADDFLKKQGLGDNVRGAVDYATGTVYLRKGATAYEAFHEMAHARHWAAIGREAYEGLGKYARESHVFQEIWKNRSQFSKAELQHAIDYMRDLRELHRLGRID